MVIKKSPKISPGLIFGGGGAYYRDDICVKNQGGLFSGGGLIFGGGGILSGFYGICFSQFLVILGTPILYPPFLP